MTVRYTDFRQIPALNKNPAYACDVNWDYLEQWLAGQQNLDTEPDFQRGYVWDDTRKKKFVEFCLHGGVSGRNLFWNCRGYTRGLSNPMVLIDGKQRLNAVLGFIRGEFAVFGDTVWSDIKNTCGFEPCVSFRMNVVEMGRAETLRWYIFMNSGGVAHTRNDIARAERLLEKCDES